MQNQNAILFKKLCKDKSFLYTTKVFKKNAEIVYEKNDEIFKIDNGGYGSMNFRGLTHLFLKIRLHFLRLSLMIINMIKKLNFITHQLPKH